MFPRVLLFALAAAVLATACGSDSPTGPSTPTATYSATDIVVGEGAEAVNGRRLTVHYTLWLYDPAQPESKGRQLESSRPGDGFAFVLGTGQVIRGWDQGVAGMKIGGQRRLILPPSLAYGPSGHELSNASLVFDIELLSVN
jgi:FKBP-type peptidyl-prolyl cis-trans isomerase